MEPIHKFNNGRGAMICNGCSTIISTGPKTEELFCDKCKQKQAILDIMVFDEEILLYEENSPTIQTEKFHVKGEPGFAVPKKDDNGSIVDWVLFNSEDKVKSYYEQMEKEVHQNRNNLNN